MKILMDKELLKDIVKYYYKDDFEKINDVIIYVEDEYDDKYMTSKNSSRLHIVLDASMNMNGTPRNLKVGIEDEFDNMVSHFLERQGYERGFSYPHSDLFLNEETFADRDKFKKRYYYDGILVTAEKIERKESIENYDQNSTHQKKKHNRRGRRY